MGRALNKYEMEVLRRALSKAKAVDASVLVDAEAEDVAPADRDWHHIRLRYNGIGWKGGGYSIIADWLAADLDGRAIELLILGDEMGRPYEVEIRRADLQPIGHLPPIEAWRDRS